MSTIDQRDRSAQAGPPTASGAIQEAHAPDGQQAPDAPGGPGGDSVELSWSDAEKLNAAVSARRAGVTAENIEASFGSGPARLSGLGDRLLVGGLVAAAEPDPSFVQHLEQDVSEAFDARPVKAAAPWRLGRATVRHAAAIATVAVVASVAALLIVSAPGRAPGGAPTAVAATGTATDATPEARATLRAPAGMTDRAGHERPASIAGPPTAKRARRAMLPAALSTAESPSPLGSGSWHGDFATRRSREAWVAPTAASPILEAAAQAWTAGRHTVDARRHSSGGAPSALSRPSV